MASSAATLAVIIVSGFVSLSAANTCIYAAVGQDVSLPFNFKGLKDAQMLKWSHNNTVVYLSNKGKVTPGKKEDVSSEGSLLVKNVQFSGAGIYQAQVVNADNSKDQWTGHLCVMEKVSKPHLAYVCDLKSGVVNLYCNVTSPQGLLFSWTQDKKTLTGETRQTLSVSLAKLKGEETFVCGVANKVSTENSDVVRPACKSASPLPKTFHCFTSTLVLAALAGQGGLIVVLLIIVIILCCRHKRIKTQMKPRNAVELRMPSVKQQETAPSSPDYETMHATEDYPHVSPKPSPRGCYRNEGQAENSPAQLSTAEERPNPSPVPKPRTKSPLKPNV
ncbi:hypothetical protein Q5P01_012718 [Channa striata]|uniref:Ig-like domain-containing protein n=1 Tax=Channa striata TaxID=64152 RepID=A0AA88MU86_CHASR|nr:hypothetical protein Q5P01_012718 [Channa striata]